MSNSISGFSVERPWRIRASHPCLPESTFEWFATEEEALAEAKRFLGCSVRVDLFMSRCDRPFFSTLVDNR